MRIPRIRFRDSIPILVILTIIIISIIYMISYFQILEKKYNEGKKKQENVAEISKVIEKVLVANMVLSDKEYEAEEKIEQITKDTNKSNEEKESLKKEVLEGLKNNTGNDNRTTILEYQAKLTDKDIVEEITYYVRSKNENIIKKEKEKHKNSTTYKLIEEKNNKEVKELKYKVTSNIGKTTGEIITILNGLMSNNKFNFTMSDSNQIKEINTESDLKKLQ
ncbi:MAG: hypothetical protein HXK70_03260 [Clostridiales bacterium]|nr:hypothetical protein [Clostridiales bacterium]